jgi:hypothetical protein
MKINSIELRESGLEGWNVLIRQWKMEWWKIGKMERRKEGKKEYADVLMC